MKITVFTRKGCCLCDEAFALLEKYRRKYGLEITAVDIDGDAALVAKHGERVPVIEVAGRERMWGKINEVLLKRMLAAEKSKN